MSRKNNINISRFKKSQWTYILASVIFIILGIMLIFDPINTGRRLVFLFGGALIAYGAFRLVSYFAKTKGEKNVSIDVIIGTVLCIGGLAVIILSGKIGDILSIILGAFLIIDGMLKIQTAINAKRSGIDSWFMVLIFSLICIAIGCVLIFVTFSDSVMWIILGVAFLFDGVQNLVSAIYSHLIVKRNNSSAINIEDHKPDGNDPSEEPKALHS